MVVTAKGLLGFFMAAFQAQPSWRLADEEDANSKSEGWNALDSKADPPLVGVMPLTFPYSCPKGNKEAPSAHYGEKEGQ